MSEARVVENDDFSGIEPRTRVSYDGREGVYVGEQLTPVPTRLPINAPTIIYPLDSGNIELRGILGSNDTSSIFKLTLTNNREVSPEDEGYSEYNQILVEEGLRDE